MRREGRGAAPQLWGNLAPGRKGAAYAYDMETLRYEVELEIRRYDLILLVVD